MLCYSLYSREQSDGPEGLSGQGDGRSLGGVRLGKVTVSYWFINHNCGFSLAQCKLFTFPKHKVMTTVMTSEDRKSEELLHT